MSPVSWAYRYHSVVRAGIGAVVPWWNMRNVDYLDVCAALCRRCVQNMITEVAEFKRDALFVSRPRRSTHTTMPELSAIALGLNGGCCFAYAVLFGVMQDKLLQMYGVEVRYPSDEESTPVPIDRSNRIPN